MQLPRMTLACGAVVGALAAGAVAAPAVAASTQTTTWSAPVANGRYEVTIKHPVTMASPGWYSVTAEGTKAVPGTIDLAWDKTFTVDVVDGRLDLALTGPKKLTGLRVYPVRVGAAPTPTPTSSASNTPQPTPSTSNTPRPTSSASNTPQPTTTTSGPTAPTPTATPTVPTSTPTAPAGTGTAAQRLYPGSPAGRPLSGIRLPDQQFNTELVKWGQWRGRPADAVVTYGFQHGYDKMANDPWPVVEWNSFPGKLIYSLPVIPTDRSASLADVAAGKYDWAFKAVANQLQSNKRGDSVVRVGWEYNIGESPWWTTTQNVGDWKAAFRHVVGVMRPVAPGLKFEFGVNCGNGLNGSTDRLAPLTMGYPGDDVVDLVGCDSYDWWQTKGSTPEQFAYSMRPAGSPGIADVVDFARAHGKLASFGEWGLAPRSSAGGGDDAYYIERMNQFFVENSDVVAIEAYFEDIHDMGNSLSMGQVPNAAAAYRRLFG